MSDKTMLRHCPRCNISIVDDTIECPVCHGVVDDMEDRDMDSPSYSVTYPDVSQNTKLMLLICRIVIFAAIATEIIVLVVNYYTFSGIYWSLIVGIGLLYGCITLLYSVLKRKSMQRVIQGQLYLSIFLVIGIDYLLGYKGWSFGYAIPIALMGIDVAMTVLMIVKINGWQSYIMTEVVTFLISIVLFVLYLMGKIPGTIFELLAMIATGLTLLGTVMIGPKLVSDELKRRFMI